MVTSEAVVTGDAYNQIQHYHILRPILTYTIIYRRLSIKSTLVDSKLSINGESSQI